MGRREDDRLSARAAWTAVSAAGRLTERAATRASLRELAESIGDPQPLMRERVLRRPPTVFSDYARDAAAAFGNANAASAIHAPLAAAIEAIKIIDDIQDEEPHGLASEVGVEAALHVAMDALAWCLELTADLPLDADDAWRAAAVAIGRGLHETASGQLIETTLDGGFDEFWWMVDHKTPPLVATALELGALSAGATPDRAASLTRLAIPIGRLLQIGDDCHDALGPDAADWRNPELNLLMRFSLSGPAGDALAELLDPSTLRDAQVLLLRDGALGYAIHAQVATLDAMREIIDELALPNPVPFAAMLEQYREDTDHLLRQSGVSPMLASHVAGSTPAVVAATR